eukprot:3803119-Rhodomonas_salina.1
MKRLSSSSQQENSPNSSHLTRDDTVYIKNLKREEARITTQHNRHSSSPNVIQERNNNCNQILQTIRSARQYAKPAKRTGNETLFKVLYTVDPHKASKTTVTEVQLLLNAGGVNAHETHVREIVDDFYRVTGRYHDIPLRTNRLMGGFNIQNMQADILNKMKQTSNAFRETMENVSIPVQEQIVDSLTNIIYMCYPETNQCDYTRRFSTSEGATSDLQIIDLHSLPSSPHPTTNTRARFSLQHNAAAVAPAAVTTSALVLAGTPVVESVAVGILTLAAAEAARRVALASTPGHDRTVPQRREVYRNMAKRDTSNFKQDDLNEFILDLDAALVHVKQVLHFYYNDEKKSLIKQLQTQRTKVDEQSNAMKNATPPQQQPPW